MHEFCQVHTSVGTYWNGIHTCTSDIHNVDNSMLHVTHVYVPG